MTMAGGLTLDDKMESRGHIAICMFCRMTCLAIFIMRVIVSGLPLEVLVVFVSKFWKRKLNKFCNIKVYRFSFFFYTYIKLYLLYWYEVFKLVKAICWLILSTQSYLVTFYIINGKYVYCATNKSGYDHFSIS